MNFFFFFFFVFYALSSWYLYTRSIVLFFLFFVGLIKMFSWKEIIGRSEVLLTTTSTSIHIVFFLCFSFFLSFFSFSAPCHLTVFLYKRRKINVLENTVIYMDGQVDFIPLAYSNGIWHEKWKEGPKEYVRIE